MAPTLYIPEPIYTMAKNLRSGATKTLGVKPSGVSRDILHRKELDALYDTVYDGLMTLRMFKKRGGRPTEADLSMIQDRLLAYKGMRRTIMERIQANRNNATKGVYRQKKNILSSTARHLSSQSKEVVVLDKAIQSFENLFQKIKDENIERRLENLMRHRHIPSVPSRKNKK